MHPQNLNYDQNNKYMSVCGERERVYLRKNNTNKTNASVCKEISGIQMHRT